MREDDPPGVPHDAGVPPPAGVGDGPPVTPAVPTVTPTTAVPTVTPTTAVPTVTPTTAVPTVTPTTAVPTVTPTPVPPVTQPVPPKDPPANPPDLATPPVAPTDTATGTAPRPTAGPDPNAQPRPSTGFSLASAHDFTVWLGTHFDRQVNGNKIAIIGGNKEEYVTGRKISIVVGIIGELLLGGKYEWIEGAEMKLVLGYMVEVVLINKNEAVTGVSFESDFGTKQQFVPVAKRKKNKINKDREADREELIGKLEISCVKDSELRAGTSNQNIAAMVAKLDAHEADIKKLSDDLKKWTAEYSKVSFEGTNMVEKATDKYIIEVGTYKATSSGDATVNGSEVRIVIGLCTDYIKCSGGKVKFLGNLEIS